MVGVQKRKIRWAISLFLVMLYFSGLTAQAQYGGGTGEPNDPYLIYTAEQMNEIGLHEEDLDKHFKLMADIDLSSYTETDFNIIGIAWNNAFTGVFNGSGHTISNFSYTSTDTDYVGLFGYVDGENALIKDLGLIDPNIDAGEGYYVGSLVGRLRDGTITVCYVDGGSVSGNDYVGGLVGSNGGIITNCYDTGRVSGDEKVGGLVGYNRGTINNCYSVGRVTGTTDVGGLVGINWDTITNSFWDIETSGQAIGAGGTGKTTAEMQMASTFVGWGCDAVWTIDEGKDYPRLWWENMPGEPPTTPFYGGGCGTEADPYLIYTAEQMNAIGADANDWDKHFDLMADIDLSSYTETDFNIIGTFSGTFDGNGHTISNFSYVSTDTDTRSIGLFRYVDGENALIKDLGLIDPNVDGTYTLSYSFQYIGSLVGHLREGTITGCYVDGGSVSGNEDVGGLVGRNSSTITGCYFDGGNVSGNEVVGGLVGDNNSTITNCYSTGSVSGDIEVGGLVGRNSGTITGCYFDGGSVSGNEVVGGLVGTGGTISNCYATGSVSGETFVGGLVGDTRYHGTITCSYATSSVSGNDYVGGLVGYNWGEVTDSLWDTQTSGQVTSDGGTGKTTAKMQDIDTYLNAGWDFVDETLNGTCDYWQISPGDYPRLRYHAGDSPVMPEGLGTTHKPYLIRDARDLGTVWFKPLAHYRLEASVDLSGITWSMAVIPWFEGTFDGNGYVISNLHIQGVGYLGLFGQLGTGAKISNLGLEAVDVNGTGRYVGGLVGRTHPRGTITGCYVDGGSVSGTGMYVGGLVGNNHSTITNCYSTCSVSGDIEVGGLVGIGGGTISNCYATGSVWGDERVGGLAGSGGTITNCYSTGSVSGDIEVGGLVGRNNSTITNCYATGSVSGDLEVGGLVGRNRGTITGCYVDGGSVWGNEWVGGLVGDNLLSGTITCSYATSSVSGNDYVGGLVGDNWGEVTDSLWDTQTSGQVTSGGGTGKTTAEMQTESTFTDAGWDFVGESTNGTEDIWWILEGQDYPRLWWEFLVVDDFESYNDFERDIIFDTWMDGWDVDTNGSEIGYANPDFLAGEHHVETTIVHSGSQSMPYFYDNSGPANYSEATANIANLVIGRDWTKYGATVLSLWFYGDPANAPEPMYVAIANSGSPLAVVYHDNPDAALIDTWTEWTIPLTEFSNQGVSLTDVDTISIGFGDKNNLQAGGSGLVFFDDIRLYRPPEPEPEQ